MIEVADREDKLYIVYLAAYIEDIAGGPRVIIEHVNGLQERGHKVELWTWNEDAKPYFDCKVPVRNADITRFSEPDIMVVTDPALISNVCANRKGRTLLLLQHDNEWAFEMEFGADRLSEAGFTKENLGYFKDGSCGIIVVSSWLQQVIQERHGLNSHLVPNGVNDELFHPKEPILQLDGPTALVIYDPQVWKGFDEATLAVLEARKTIPDLQLLIMGRYFPQMPPDTKAYYALAPPAIFFNRPKQSDIARVYSSASVFISASWKEGFGLPGLEAMACGVPLVTTDSGGVREYAVPDETALIVPAKSIPAITDAVLKVLSEKPLRDELVSNGLKKAAEFNWDKSIDALEAILKPS